MSLKSWLFVCGLVGVSPGLLAADNLYAVVSAGYGETEFDNNEEEGGNYKLAIGYQFDRQWYAEFGYQRLADEKLKQALPTRANSIDVFQPGMQADALFAALLGKASGQLGELFYRVGVLKTDVKGQSLIQGNACELGQAQTSMTVEGQDYILCEYDEGGVAGVFGLGFDFYLGTRSMLRTEIEYIKGQDDLSAIVANVGLRYNF